MDDDPQDPVLDVDAGATGALMAWVGPLLRRQRHEAFPYVAERVCGEIRVRPGSSHRQSAPLVWHPDAPPNSWAPWITANALACFLAMGTSAEQERAASHIEGADFWEDSGVNTAFTLTLAREPVPETDSSFTVGNARINHCPGWHATFEKLDVEGPRLVPVRGPRCITQPSAPWRQSPVKGNIR